MITMAMSENQRVLDGGGTAFRALKLGLELDES
jgi:hypothetical protein